MHQKKKGRWNKLITAKAVRAQQNGERTGHRNGCDLNTDTAEQGRNLDGGVAGTVVQASCNRMPHP